MISFPSLGRFLGIFFFLIIVNITTALTLHRRIQRSHKIAVILEEFQSLKGFVPTDTGTEVLGLMDQKDAPKDTRVATLKGFFRKYESPLYDQAETIVSTADKYGLDYRLLPAIAMQESGVCRVIPRDSHNCWGWGIYGDTVTRFSSYPEAIETISRGLKEHYIDKGLTTPDAIMAKYTPSSNGSWAHGVNTFLKALEF